MNIEKGELGGVFLIVLNNSFEQYKSISQPHDVMCYVTHNSVTAVNSKTMDNLKVHL